MDLNVEQETLRELSSRKQNLLLELKNYEATAAASLGVAHATAVAAPAAPAAPASAAFDRGRPPPQGSPARLGGLEPSGSASWWRARQAIATAWQHARE